MKFILNNLKDIDNKTSLTFSFHRPIATQEGNSDIHYEEHFITLSVAQDEAQKGRGIITEYAGNNLNTLETYLFLDTLFATEELNCNEIALTTNTLKDKKLSIEPALWTIEETTGLSIISKAAFYQIREIWLSKALLPITPDVRTVNIDTGRAVPFRPVIPEGTLYERYIPQVGKNIRVRKLNIEQDSERFHRWQNDPRVAEFWEYPFSQEKLNEYLRNCLADSYREPLIIEMDNTPFAYIEIYWAFEDRISPYYQSQPFDQGLHLLVGEPDFLGNGLLPYWLNSVCHFLFLKEPRSELIVGEPRHDNHRLIKWLDSTAWFKAKEFDFPHKRSALLKCERSTFFETL